ncbi:peptidyl-arginine deiminase [Salmonella enterica subsp. diarizonae]|nr:peptidyl-arginine deiminase [Salmonella enterica subsp. diarizonae]
MIILVGSHKGGVGKSTVYIHILMCLILRSGKRVAALECDDQHSVKDWLDDRRAQGIQPDVDYYECYHDIPAMSRKLDKKYDIVLLDAPGRRSPEFSKCLSVADLFISLVDPSSQIEINTLGLMVADVFQYQASVNKGLKAVLVMNKCDTHPSDIDASSFRKDIEADQDNWIPVARQRLYQRKAYKRAYNEGVSVHEFNDRRGNQARGEIELLLRELELLAA